MKIKLIYFDKFKDIETKTIFESFVKRIKNYINLEIKELKEITNTNENETNIRLSLEKEAKLIKNEIKPQSILIILDILGKQMDSIEFANLLKKNIEQTNKKEIIFLIGSSHGIDDSIKQISDYRISFSKMTFCKNIFKILFIEQLYRAISIINNVGYHK